MFTRSKFAFVIVCFVFGFVSVVAQEEVVEQEETLTDEEESVDETATLDADDLEVENESDSAVIEALPDEESSTRHLGLLSEKTSNVTNSYANYFTIYLYLASTRRLGKCDTTEC